MSKQISYSELLMEMLSIPATSRKEEKRAEFLESYLNDLGIDVARIHNNLLIGCPQADGGKPAVLLTSHMDTVSPAAGWETDPFTPLLNADRITGLGSNDAGASVVTMIASFLKMNRILKERINLMLLICAEEEVSGMHGISSVLDRLGNLDAVIVGEPTGMQPAVAERGLMVLDGEVKGKAGHAARKEGENAIYSAMKDIQSIHGLDFPKQSKWLPPAGAQVTMISAGTGHNVVPDLCKYVVDVRSNDRYGNEELLKIIRSVCHADLEPRSTRLKPSVLPSDHALMCAIKAMGLKPFGSSTLSDMALIPFPSVKLGPGFSDRSHSAGEFILIRELEEGITVYCRFLESLSHVLVSTSKHLSA
jgi:acetylornithine deacetylase